MTTVAVQQAIEIARESIPKAEGLLREAEEFTIVVPEHYEMACKFVIAAKEAAKHWKDWRLSVTRPMDEAKANFMAVVTPVEQYYTQQADILGRKALSWKSEQDRIREETEREARQTALREQARIDAQTEKKAEKLEAKGEHDQAEAVREGKPQIPMPIVSTQVPKVKGFATRKYWSWRCKVCGEKSCVHLIKALCLAGELAYGYLSVNQVAINGTVEAQKSMANIPGADIFEDERAARTGKR